MTRRSPRQSLAQIFAVPALIALTTTLALVGALVADGIWDVASSICLAIPAAVFCLCVVWRKSARTLARINNDSLRSSSRTSER
jgi:hypothetical protein